jgi:GTP-binding protein
VVEYGGRVYRLIDTAGIRRKRSIGLRVDRYSVVASLNAIARADVAVLVIDATQPVADQDRRVAGRVQEAGKGLVLVANKMDLVDAGERSRREVLEEIKEALLFVKGSALCPTAAKHGKRVFDVLRAIDDVAARQFQRVATSAVNRVLESLAKTHPPPTVGNVRGKLFFGAQVATAPPTFVIVCRRPDAIPPTYRRFVERRLREAFGFDGVPMIVAFRSRERQAERSANQKKRRLKESRE